MNVTFLFYEENVQKLHKHNFQVPDKHTLEQIVECVPHAHNQIAVREKVTGKLIFVGALHVDKNGEIAWTWQDVNL